MMILVTRWHVPLLGSLLFVVSCGPTDSTSTAEDGGGGGSSQKGDGDGGGGGSGGGGDSGWGGGGVGSTGSTDGGGQPRDAGGNDATPDDPVKSAGCGKTATLKTGKRTITSSGASREYTIDIPSDYDNAKPYRLVFGLHWMGGTMEDVVTGQTVQPPNTWMYFGLKELDTTHSAIFVAPQGIGNGWANTNGNDTKLLDDIIKEVGDDLCIDTSRIFAGGFSYGGMFSSTLACTKQDVYRALAPQNGSASCPNGKPVAFIAVGSTDGTNQSLQSLARTIAKTNGCSDPNQAMPIPKAGSRSHTCTSFDGCPAKYPVRFCAFDEGHKAAPFDGANGDQDDGKKTWVPGEVWKFYTQF